jgi:hypothetical protein
MPDLRMCERHYGHLAPSYVDAMCKSAPKFEFKPNVGAIG